MDLSLYELLDLRSKLDYRRYEKLGLQYLQPLRDEVEARLQARMKPATVEAPEALESSIARPI